jgi:hypothetical protein
MQFRAAVSELVTSYNGLEEGKQRPAKVDDGGETSITISCTQHSQDGTVDTVAVTIKSELLQDKYTIASSIEKWTVGSIRTRQMESLAQIDFILDADPECDDTWLAKDGDPKKFTAFQAAEFVLVNALLDQRAREALKID